jgi:hypothetical protein
MITDKWTGKPVDNPSDRLPRYQHGFLCDECGSTLIRDCLNCGAPNCCWSCCIGPEEDPQPHNQQED